VVGGNDGSNSICRWKWRPWFFVPKSTLKQHRDVSNIRTVENTKVVVNVGYIPLDNEDEIGRNVRN
jgi:hypothetical protein